MANKKILIVKSLLCSLVLGMFFTSFSFAQEEQQPIQLGRVAQRIIEEEYPSDNCKYYNAGILTNGSQKMSFYDGQYGYISNTLRGNSLSTVLHIYNTYPIGVTQRSLIYVYNPFGALSFSLVPAASNSFIPDFSFKSNIKRAGDERVYVARQSTAGTYFVYAPGVTRTTMAAQLVHEIRRQDDQVLTSGPTDAYQSLIYSTSISTGILWNGNLSLASDNNALWIASHPITNANEFLCQNIYVARCGDGVTDNVDKVGTTTTDGKYGITVGGTMINWGLPMTSASAPHEACDMGALNGDQTAIVYTGTDGQTLSDAMYCTLTCTLAPANVGSCGDAIINDGEDLPGHGPLYSIGGVEQYEECDEGEYNSDDSAESDCNMDCETHAQNPRFPPIFDI